MVNVAQGTVKWLHATGFLLRDDPSDQPAAIPKGLRGHAAHVARDVAGEGQGKAKTVDDKAKELATGKGFATEAGKKAANGVISFVLDWFSRGGKLASRPW